VQLGRGHAETPGPGADKVVAPSECKKEGVNRGDERGRWCRKKTKRHGAGGTEVGENSWGDIKIKE